jgi:outer membrane receptor for monomeric catechols
VTTALGNVVYEAVSMVGTALSHYWVLKAIESFQSSAALDSKEHISKLIDTQLIEVFRLMRYLVTKRSMPLLG